jgi:hemerythrin-like metal-binding protein
MDWIVWDDTVNTGHTGMDADHRELAGLFARLRDAVDSGAGKAACAKVLDAVIGHAQAHFDMEQRLMVRHRYPKTELHAAEHAMLIRQALDFRKRFDIDSAASTSALMNFADVWLAFHVLFSDKEMAAFLAHDPGAPAKE